MHRSALADQGSRPREEPIVEIPGPEGVSVYDVGAATRARTD